MKKYAAVWCIVIAGVLTLAVGWLSYRLEADYIADSSYFYDSVYYQYYNARLGVRLDHESRWAVAWDEWVHNDRHPLRTVPLLLFYPAALTQPFGHLFTFLPSFFILLCLFTWLVYRRTNSWWYSLMATSVFCSIPIFYDVTYGVAVYWLEWQAAAWAASAGICLLLALHNQAIKQSTRRWLVGFAISAAAATLSRYISAMFVFVMCVPMLAAFFWRSQQKLKDIIIPLVILVGSIGYFIAAHFQSNMHFYSTYGYALNQTFASSFSFVVSSLLAFVTVAGPFHFLLPIVCVFAFVVNLWMTRRQGHWLEGLLTVWLGVGPLLFLLAMRTVGAMHPIAYSLVGLILTALAPMTWPSLNRLCHWMVITVGVLVVLIFGRQHLLQFNTQQTSLSAQKQFDQSLSTALSQLDDDTMVWNGFFDEYTWIPTMEAYYQTGRLYLPAGQPFFNAHQSAWFGDYPGLTDEQIAERVYAGTGRWVDVAVVLADASPAHTSEWMDNSTSQVVSEYMSTHLATDPQWQPVFTVDSFYGELIGYRNTASTADNYNLLLEASPLVRPSL